MSIQNKSLTVPLHHDMIQDHKVEENQTFWEKLTRSCRKKGKLPPRVIYINKDQDSNTNQGFHGNSINTTKYRWWNFLILNLFEQFYHRHANLYFLLVASISLIPKLSPVGSFGTMLTLAIVVLVQMLKDFAEDLIKFWVDMETNRRSVMIARGGVWEKGMWKDVETGDIVKVYNKENFPADILMIDSSDPTGACFIETAMLDGETDLKYRRAPEATWKLWIGEEDKLERKHGEFEAKLEYDQPNTELYKFSGNLQMKPGLENKIPVNNESILLRGSKLKNTDWIVGVAIYTGHDTKIMKNRNKTPHKRSQLDVLTNNYIYLMFAIQIVLCLTCVTAMTIVNAIEVDRWYLQLGVTPGSLAFQWFRSFWTFFILFSNLIPISLYVSMETGKVIQGWFISKDVEMYYEDPKGPPIPAVVRTSSINEDLGQVSFIFSDKTGTLTANEMKFFKCSVSGIAYGKGITEIKRAANQRNGVPTEDERPEEFQGNAELQFWDPDVNKTFGDWTRMKDSEEFEEFLRCIAVCHTVIVEKNRETGLDTLSAASPDENALVHGSRGLGVEFFSRELNTLKIKVMGKEESYEILDVIEFTSDRKRMSIVVRNPKGEVVVYSKGADSFLWNLVVDCPKELKDATMNNLKTFAEEGLRTLLCCKAIIPNDKWEKLSAAMLDARRILIQEDKVKAEEKVFLEMEKDFKLIGATALEDKLQVGVPFTISELKKAKIKIWVLTGDKLDTAENIGHACDLLNREMFKYRIQDSQIDDDDESVRVEKLTSLLKNALLESAKRKNQGMLIEGKVGLTTIFQHESLRDLFVKVAIRCDAVVCCRVSPKQKADVVELVMKKLQGGYVTLAIGDGGNDVSMIQSAKVGVGIAGKEGMQAANAADYAFGQFRFLRRLLIVHGRWSYRRIAKLILYSFYKNCVLYLTQFFFVFWSAFSGSSVHDRWNVAFFNTVFTALPIMAVAIFDRDLKANVAEDFPQLYKQGQKRRFFTFSIFAGYVLNSIFHSFVCFIFPMYAYANTAMSTDPSLLGTGMVIYTSVVLVVTLKVSLETASWTVINFSVVAVSVISWWIFSLIYSSLYRVTGLGNALSLEWYYIVDAYTVFGSGLFWLTILLTATVAILRDFAFKAWRRMSSVELYYAAISKGKNVSKEAVESGFPLEEGIPVRLKGPVTVKGLFGTAIERELGGVLQEKHIQILTQNQSQEAYSGFAFSGEDGGKMMKERTQSILQLNQYRLEKQESEKKK